MPAVNAVAVLHGDRALHEGYALALDGVGNHYFGLVGYALKSLEDAGHGLEVMTVAALHVPSEGLELGFEITQALRREEADFFVIVHLLLVALLMLVFPFSKLLHAPGIFFSPSRNQVDNPREKRHIAAWARKLEES